MVEIHGQFVFVNDGDDLFTKIKHSGDYPGWYYFDVLPWMFSTRDDAIAALLNHLWEE